MYIRPLNDNDISICDAFLAEHAETSMFLRSNIARAGLEWRDKTYHGFYMGAFDERNVLKGILVHYWNENMLFQCVSKNVLNALLDAYVQNPVKPLSGIVGENDQALTVIRYFNLNESAFKLNKPENLYRIDLTTLKSEPLPDGFSARHIAEDDMPLLMKWITAYDIEALGCSATEDEQKARHRELLEIIPEKRRWILEKDGTPVALAGFNATLPDMVQVGPVWTPPENRNKGYAKMVTHFILSEAAKNNVRSSILFTNTPAAIRVYEKIGYKKCGAFRLSLLKNSLDIHLEAQVGK